MDPIFAFLDFSPSTLLILGVIAVLLYGERLPEVARTAGRRFMDFKKGFDGMQDQLREAINTPPPSHLPLDQPMTSTSATSPSQEQLAENEPKEGDPICPEAVVGPVEAAKPA
jgi:sec-independent protein translocase protein TatA